MDERDERLAKLERRVSDLLHAHAKLLGLLVSAASSGEKVQAKDLLTLSQEFTVASIERSKT